MNELFDRCSWSGNGFMKMNAEFREITPIVNSNTGLFYIDGELTGYLPGERGEFWREYKWVQYYLMHNFKN